VLPARTISDLVALLDAQRVDVTFDEGTGARPEPVEGTCPEQDGKAHPDEDRKARSEPAEGADPGQNRSALALQCGRTLAHIRGWGAGEFPTLPLPASEPVARVEANALRDGIGRVVYAASPDPARPALCGTLMQFAEGQVTLVAADGFRLALYTVPLVAPVAEPFDPGALVAPVVPARGMRELQRLAREGQVSLALDESRRFVIFEVGDAVIGCQLGGKYPDYRPLIPQAWDVRAVVDRAALTQACRTTRALSESGSLHVEFAPPGQLVVSSASVETGEGRTELKAEVEGTGVEVTLNVRYLADAVTATNGAQVALTASAPTPPTPPQAGGLGGGAVLVRPVGMESQLGLIMPMQTG